MINEESVEYLLNSFSIRIFNDNYTQTILHLIITDSPNLAWWAGNSHIRGWTPAQAEWNAIKANNGTPLITVAAMEGKEISPQEKYNEKD